MLASNSIIVDSHTWGWYFSVHIFCNIFSKWSFGKFTAFKYLLLICWDWLHSLGITKLLKWFPALNKHTSLLIWILPFLPPHGRNSLINLNNSSTHVTRRPRQARRQKQIYIYMIKGRFDETPAIKQPKAAQILSKNRNCNLNLYIVLINHKAAKVSAELWITSCDHRWDVKVSPSSDRNPSA